MGSRDIELSTNTPKPADRVVKAKLERLLTPAVRDRTGWWWEDGTLVEDKCLGDVLERPPVDCSRWRWWYSPTKGEVGVLLKPCGNRTCPTCVAGYLADRAAPAWDVWTWRAVRSSFADDAEWRRVRRRLGITTSGPNSERGMLVLRLPAEVAVWGPATGDLDGERLSGKELNRRLVADLRAIAVPPYQPKGDGAAPELIGLASSSEWIDHASAVAGVPLKVNGRRFITARVDDERGRAWADAMRGR